MELRDVTDKIDGFTSWKHADRIRFLSWWLHTSGAKEYFQGADIIRCYTVLHMEAPSMHPFIRSLVEQRHVLKSNAGYRLEAKVRRRFDEKYGDREETVVVDKLLSDLPRKLSSDRQREYLEEALGCFRNKHWRSAIIMTWNLAYDHLLHFTLKKKLPEFNAALARNNERKKRAVINQRDEFNDLREGLVIDVCRAGDVVNGTTCKLLKMSLDTRNDAAHPSGATFNKLIAEPYISALVETVVLGLTP